MSDCHTSIPQNCIAKFSDFLAKHMGIYYPEERWKDLEKKMLLIMDSFGFEDPASWVNYLEYRSLDYQEMAILAHHLTVGETYFFRDAKTFEVLEKEILPSILLAHQIDKSIRIWCAACCTGEEPYSLAILLHRLIPNISSWNISIIGTDINPEFLQKAEQASYKKWSFRATPAPILKKYFIQQTEGRYALIPEVQRLVKFSYLNLVDELYPSYLYDIDLVLCHNVLIYFSESQVKRVIRQMVKTVRHDGWLSVSAVEVPFIHDPQLSYRNFNESVFFQKGYKSVEKEKKVQDHLKKRKHEAEHHFSPSKIVLKETPAAAPVTKREPLKPKEEGLYQACINLIEKQKYKEVVDQLSTYLAPYQINPAALSSHLKEVVLLIRSYANLGELTQALNWCQEAIKANKLDPTLYYLKATIEEALEDSLNAVQSLKRALFLEPNFIMAYYKLGVIERRQGNNGEAERYFKNALALTDNYPNEEILPGTDEITIESLKDLLLSGIQSYDR